MLMVPTSTTDEWIAACLRAKASADPDGWRQAFREESSDKDFPEWGTVEMAIMLTQRELMRDRAKAFEPFPPYAILIGAIVLGSIGIAIWGVMAFMAWRMVV